MSLLAVYRNSGKTIIVSDLLITSLGVSKPIYVPILNHTVSDIDFPDEYKPSSFHVKNVIIKETLCIGFTGEVSEISLLQNCVKDYFLHRDVTMDNLYAFHNSFNFTTQYSKSTAIFLVCLHDGVHALEIGNWNHVGDNDLQQFTVSGSGSYSWINQFNDIAQLRDNRIVKHPKQTLLEILSTCTYFISTDRESPDNMRDGWGGGFDIITFDGEKFEKLDSMSYLWMSVQISEDGLKIKYDAIVNFSYLGEHLIIRNFDVSKNEYHAYYAAPSYIKLPPESDSVSQFFESYAVGCVVTIENGSQNSQKFIIAYVGDHTNEVNLKLNYMNGHIGIGISNNLYNEIEKISREMSLW